MQRNENVRGCNLEIVAESATKQKIKKMEAKTSKITTVDKWIAIVTSKVKENSMTTKNAEKCLVAVRSHRRRWL